MATALISLGSNVGDRADALRRSLALLAPVPGLRITATSSFHETKPVGGPASQEKFLNAAALLETDLPPRELFLLLQDVEQKLGRIRTERWGPRTVDLDLLLYDELELETPELTLPHPRMSFRRFVLEPAAEVAAEMVHPVCGNTIGGLLAHLNESPRLIATNLFPTDFHDALSREGSIRWLPLPESQSHPSERYGSPHERTLRHWEDSELKTLVGALQSMPPTQWLLVHWSQVPWPDAGRVSTIPERAAIAAGGVLPRLFLDVVLQPGGVDRLLPLRRFLREEYRGPLLGLVQPDEKRLREELVAAMAAME